MSSISAGTTTGTALVSTGDTTGQLVLKTNGSTTAVTIGTDQVVTLAQPLPAASGGTGLTAFPAPGTSGNVLTSNGTAWTSSAPAPSAGTLQAVASGTLADGSKVVVNSDGTVSAISSTASSLGTAGTFVSANVFEPDVVFDVANNKVVVVYNLGGSSGAVAVVGTVSGTSISFGTPVTVVTGQAAEPTVVYDPVSGKIVIAYRTASNGVAIVGTVSGTSISFGSTAIFQSGTAENISAVYDVANNKVVFTYTDGSAYVRAVVGTVSGTSISFGTPVIPRSQDTSRPPTISYNSSVNKVLIVVSISSLSNELNAYIGTVSGTSISFNNTTTGLGTSDYSIFSGISSSYDPAVDRHVVFYSPNSAMTGQLLQISGTSVVSITTAGVGGPVSANGGKPSIARNSITNVMVLSYNATSGGTGVYRRVYLTPISITLQPSVTIETNIANEYLVLTYDTTSNQAVAAYIASGPVGQAVPFVPENQNLTATNYIGISNGAYTNGQTATIQTIGAVDDAQSGLLAGQRYFVQPNGALSLTAGSPSVIAGTAISATSIIVKG
jgi:hypothetical protein